MTTPPWSLTSWAMSWPTMPRPMMATVSPRPTLAMRTALRAMLPSVVKHACSNGTDSGTLATSWRPAWTVSACPVVSPP